MAKPKRISHDNVSIRQAHRVFEGIAADAKGPISTPTPEGYKYYFLIMDIFSSYYWPVLVASQD